MQKKWWWVVVTPLIVALFSIIGTTYSNISAERKIMQVLLSTQETRIQLLEASVERHNVVLELIAGKLLQGFRPIGE